MLYQQTAIAFSIPFPEAESLRRLLGSKGLYVASGAAHQAWREALARFGSPGDRSGSSTILLEAVQAWACAFDPGARALLAPCRDGLYTANLVLTGGDWRLVRAVTDRSVLLEDESGQSSECCHADLDDAPSLSISLSRTASARHPGSPLALLMQALLGRRRVLIEIVLASLMVNVLAIASSLFAMQVYDRVVPSFAWSTLWALATGVLIIIVFETGLRLARAQALDRLACELDEALSQTLFDHLLSIRLDARPRSLGSLAARLGGVEMIRSFLTASILFVFVDLPFALGFIVVIALIGASLAWVYAGLAIVALGVGWLAQHRMRKLVADQLEGSRQRNGLLVEAIQGAETLQAGGASWRFSAAWAALAASMSRQQIALRSAINRVTTLSQSLSSLAFVLALVFGVWLIEQGFLSIGGLIACALLGGRVVQPIAQAVLLSTQWHGAREAMQQLQSVLSLPASREPDVSLLAPAQLDASLGLRDVEFRLGSVRKPAIQLDELAFAAGSRVAVVGQSGAGKSTLLRLMAGLYRPQSGEVRVGGVDVTQLHPLAISETVGYLPQEVRLFRGTLRDNIELAGPRLSDSRMAEIIRDSGLESLVSEHPRGLDLDIAEDGSGLSAGQRQLVGLARLLAQSPRIWLLDEPSAALDGQAEALVVRALQRWPRPTDTVIIATHKSALLALANRIVVMRGGCVVQDGERAQILQSASRQPQAKRITRSDVAEALAV